MIDYWVADVPESVVRTQSVLVAGASEAQLRAVEARLGCSLPPSYRHFLSLSNGAFGGPVGLQLAETGGPYAKHTQLKPEALLASEHIGPASFDEPLLLDLVSGYNSNSPHGLTTPYECDAEVSYLAAPWSDLHENFKPGQAYWSLRIGWVRDPATVMLLNPLVADAAGEWEVVVVHVDQAIRYRSFQAWLEVAVNRADIQRTPTATFIMKSTFKDLDMVGQLVGVEADLEWLTREIEGALVPGADVSRLRLALAKLEWIDTRDNGVRFSSWIRRMVDDPLFDEVAVVPLIGDSTAKGLPSVTEIYQKGRSADLQNHMQMFSTDALAEVHRSAPDPIVASYLEQRGHPLVDEPARLELDKLLPTRHWVSFRTETRHEVHHEPGELTSEQIIDIGARRELPPVSIARALVRSGYPHEAVDYLELKRNNGDQVYLLYAIAEIDTPHAWDILDKAADSPERPTSLVNLVAAARSHSPLLPPRAATLLQGTELESLTALLALEIQPTELAGDTLLTAWRADTHFGALRSLARRRDARIVEDCLLFLTDPEEDIRQVGAENLRDLRVRSTEADLVAALETAQQDNLVVVLAHTLAMFKTTTAAPLLRAKAQSASNQQLADLLTTWATQLTND